MQTPKVMAITITRCFLIGVLFFLPLTSSAQNIDSLEAELRSPELPTDTRAQVLNILSREMAFIDPVRSAQMAKDALALSLTYNNETQAAYAYRNLSNVHTFNQNYFLSVEYVQRALAIFYKTADSVGIANCYISLGHAFRGLQDRNQEIHYHKKAYEMFSRWNIRERTAVAAHNLGESYFNHGELSKSVTLTSKAILLNNSINNRPVLSSCFKVMGMIAMARKDHLRAQSYFNKVLAISDSLGLRAQKVAMLESLLMLADISKLKGNEQLHLDYLLRAAALSERYNLAVYLERVYWALISHFSVRNDPRNVQKYLDEFKSVSEKVRQEQLNDRVELMKSVEHVHALETENRMLLRDNGIQSARIQSRTAFLQVMIVFAAIAIYMLIKLLQANRKIKSSNKVLNLQNDTIESQRRQLQLANDTKDKFFSIVAHDLRSPLTTLKSFAGLLVEYLDDMSREAILDMSLKLQQQVDNTLRMTDNLLTWARLQAKGDKPVREVVRIAEVANDVTSVYAEIAASKRIVLESTVDQQASIFVDRNQFTFILRNLVNNAIKYTMPGGWVKLQTQFVDMGLINIIVSDNGIGLSKEQIKGISMLGKSRSVTGTVGEKGTGLGLILVQEFIHLNDGILGVESQEGAGSSFKVQLGLAP
jgi:signal transduction histidine kinase